ncbi:universal stress protein [Dactylosporangium cerinum]|uniref:Universal stress protein n=1 Tax=Dactylosporangium cerinum TaxID=1434730 RepID=A0ABV9VR85_9ACTN
MVGIDGSAASLGAARWAAHEAKLRGTPLEIVHVAGTPQPYDVPDDPRRDVAVEAAVEVRMWQPGIKVTTATWQCNPTAALIERSRHAALIVVGSRGQGGFSALRIGSVGAQLSGHARCPVLVVHHADRWAAPAAALPQHGRIVVGADGSVPAAHALEHAFLEATLRRTPLTVMRAWQAPHHRHGRTPDLAQIQAAEEQHLAADVEPWAAKFPDVAVDLRTERGNAAAVLLAAGQDAIMVVLGARGRDGFDALRLGSVTQQVLHHATGAVLIVHAG